MLLLLGLLTLGAKTGTAHSFRCLQKWGDSQGIRWGFEGDSQAIRGIRSKNACVCREFQRYSLETTNPFYNIKMGEGNGNWLSLWLALTRTVFPLPTLLCASRLALRFPDFHQRSFASRNL